MLPMLSVPCLGFWKESVVELEVNWDRAVTPTQSEMQEERGSAGLHTTHQIMSGR